MTEVEARFEPEQMLVQIIHGEPLSAEILEALSELGLQQFTRWVRVQGQGETSPPHLDDHIWPGANHVVQVVLEADRLEPLFEALRAIKARAPELGLRAFYHAVCVGV